MFIAYLVSDIFKSAFFPLMSLKMKFFFLNLKRGSNQLKPRIYLKNLIYAATFVSVSLSLKCRQEDNSPARSFFTLKGFFT
jgi:hypothetical protein